MRILAKVGAFMGLLLALQIRLDDRMKEKNSFFIGADVQFEMDDPAVGGHGRVGDAEIVRHLAPGAALGQESVDFDISLRNGRGLVGHGLPLQV